MAPFAMSLTPAQKLKLKIFGTLGVLGTVLLFMLGYTLGSVHEDARAQRVSELLQRSYGISEERLKVCNKRTSVIDAMATKEERLMEDVQYLQSDNEAVLEMILVKKNAIQEVEAGITECEDTRSELTSPSSMRQTIDELSQEQVSLTYQVQQSNATRNSNLHQMKVWIRTLRLENGVLRERLDQREKRREEKQKLLKEKKKRERAGDTADLAKEIADLEAKLKELMDEKTKDQQENDLTLHGGRNQVKKDNPDYHNVDDFDIAAELGEDGNAGPKRPERP